MFGAGPLKPNNVFCWYCSLGLPLDTKGVERITFNIPAYFASLVKPLILSSIKADYSVMSANLPPV